MERNAETDRTPDSVEQLDAGEPVNPITGEETELSEPGTAFAPGEREPDENEEDEGPPGRTTQMPR
jgi:hypothetical protein